MLDWMSAIALITLFVFLFAASLCLIAALFLLAVSILRFAIEDFREIWGKRKPSAPSNAIRHWMLTNFSSIDLDRYSHHLDGCNNFGSDCECDC